MPKICYKEIKFQSKSLELIELVNGVVDEIYKAVCVREMEEKAELQTLVDNYEEAITYLKGWNE